MRGLFPAGYCHPPTSELGKTERGPISTSGPSIFSMSPTFSMLPNQAISSDKSIRFSPLASARSLTTLSWPEALNARGSRRAGRMAISRNPCSHLIANSVSHPTIRLGTASCKCGALHRAPDHRLRLIAEILFQHPLQESRVGPCHVIERAVALGAESEDDNTVVTTHELSGWVHDVGILHSVVEFRNRTGEVVVTLDLAVQDS